MLSLLIYLDKQLTIFLNHLLPDNIFLHNFFSFFSFIGTSIFIWVIFLILIVFFEEKAHPGISKKDKKFIIIFTLTIFFSFLTTEVFLKNLIRRPRPFYQIQNLKLKIQNYPKDFSFPSGHSTIVFAAATILSFFDKKRRFIYFTIASIVAYSRLYLGVHYFLDIVGGGIIGILIGNFIYKFFNF
ncbi:MAG: phosphatase PAP2 family protein [Microgenomates group bacterium]